LVFQNSVKYSSLITIPVTSAMIVLADQLVHAAYGNGYELAPMFLRLFVFNSLFVGIGNLSIDNFLNGQGRTRVTFLKSLSNMCIGVPLGLALAPRFGIIGLLVTMIIAPKTGQIYGLIRLRKDFGFTVDWAASVKIYTSSGISSLATYFLLAFIDHGIWVDLLIGGLAFLLVYILVVATIGTLERNDLQNLRNIMGSIGPFTPFFSAIITMIEKLMDKTRP
jgi:O-antigen/teichoic acid export membrane protein